MSDPVHRKGSPLSPPVAEQGGTTGAGEAFRGAVETTRAEAASPSARADSLAALAGEVRAGRLDSASAVEELVQRVLAERAPASLPPEHRARLEQVLRAELANNPGLQLLQKNLGGETR